MTHQRVLTNLFTLLAMTVMTASTANATVFTGPVTGNPNIADNDASEWKDAFNNPPASVPGVVGDGDTWLLDDLASIGNFQTFGGNRLEVGTGGRLRILSAATVAGNFALTDGGQLFLDGNQGNANFNINGGSFEITGNSEIFENKTGRFSHINVASVFGDGNVQINGGANKRVDFRSTTDFSGFTGTIEVGVSEFGFWNDASGDFNIDLDSGSRLTLGRAEVLTNSGNTSLGDATNPLIELSSLTMDATDLAAGDYTWTDLANLSGGDAFFGVTVYFQNQDASGNVKGFLTPSEIAAGSGVLGVDTINTTAIDPNAVVLRILGSSGGAVPEPTTAMMTMLALGAATMRRRSWHNV